MTLGSGADVPRQIEVRKTMKIRFIKSAFIQAANFQGHVSEGKIEDVRDDVALDLIGRGAAAQIDPTVRPTMSPSRQAPGVYRPGEDDGRGLPGRIA